MEYSPPSMDIPFATMNLVFTRAMDSTAVAAAMLEELAAWVKRYGVPIMVSAWDVQERRLRPKDEGESFLVGWQTPAGEITHSWRHTDLDAFLKANQSQPDLRTIYKDVPYKTDAQVKANADAYVNERRRQNRYLKAILFGWLAVIPAGIALFQYFGPEWLGLVALIFGLWKAGRAGFRLWRNSKPSPWEQAKAEKQRKMDHYYYHCEKDPAGFARLKIENFQNQAAGRTRKQAEALSKLKG
ncbi:MAG: hypothetical protein JSR91_06510 [Proteobacteria bacterium]|nr:hypothetical protein [Pseudomonadota bacterium]